MTSEAAEPIPHAGDDRAAFAEAFDEHAARLSRVAYLMLHDQAAAEDAVQEAFARAWERRAEFRGDADRLTWLYSILLNVCRMALRRSRPRGADDAALEGGRRLTPEPHGIFTSVVRREVKRQLVMAMGWLNEPQREVFVLHYVEGLSFDQVAGLLGLNVNTARSLGHRARAVLMKKVPRLAREYAAED